MENKATQPASHEKSDYITGIFGQGQGGCILEEQKGCFTLFLGFLKQFEPYFLLKFWPSNDSSLPGGTEKTIPFCQAQLKPKLN